MPRSIGLCITTLVATVILTGPASAEDLRSLDLRSDDIACMSCALNIMRTVSRMKDIKQVKTSYRDRTIHVKYDNDNTSEDLIIRNISVLGFRVERLGPR